VRDSSAGTIAGRLPGGYAERNLKIGCGIRMGGRNTVPLNDCDMPSGFTPEFQTTLNVFARHLEVPMIGFIEKNLQKGSI
jgi:hypothetical protein